MAAGAGHDVVEAAQLGPDPGDRTLLRFAHDEHRILITMDADFGELIHLHDQPHAGLMRLPDVPVPERIALMAELISRYRPALEERAIVTVRGGRLRISHQPS